MVVAMLGWGLGFSITLPLFIPLVWLTIPTSRNGSGVGQSWYPLPLVTVASSEKGPTLGQSTP